jgi:hypothetical protein
MAAVRRVFGRAFLDGSAENLHNSEHLIFSMRHDPSPTQK